MIAVGITGHRPHRLKVPQAKLARRVRSVLSGLMKTATSKGATGPVLDIVSPLAEGCDQIVARETLALGQHLTAVIPFERRAYEATFSNPALIKDFRELWKASHERAKLKASLARPEAGYVAVGMVTLARSDLMLTIWDGKPAEGRGGTPEILQSAIELGLPVIWIHAAVDRKPTLLMAKPRGKKAVQLARVARSAKPLTAAAYRDVVALIRGNTSR